ncbi:MAG TPA: outer membrane lipoprotein carrier protein LolA [Verrucomicrobiae bacterium]|nr:outer membrane lipoprotein carrier protein LolA [Verrucomicrobiae bacterium]
MSVGRIVIAVICSICVAGAARAETNDAGAFLRRLAATTAKADTLFVEFAQERHLALFEEPLRTEGYLVFQRPNSIRWEVTKPYASILVCAGSNAAQFERTDGKWKRLDLSYMKSIGNFVAGMAMFLEGRYMEQQSDYDASVRTGDGTVLTLKPKQKQAAQFIDAFELQFGDDLTAGARRVTMRQPDGDWTSIQLTNAVANKALPPGTFDMQSPLDIESVRKAITNADR